MDDTDELWVSETDHRGQRVSLQTCVNFSLLETKHYRIDVTTFVVERKTGGPASAQVNRIEELADRVSRDTTITNQQIDLAIRLMLQQVSRPSDGDYDQSVMVQRLLDCGDRTTASSIAFVSFREQPMHFHDNQTRSLRVVDPIAVEGVWATIDDGCNSCCHVEVLPQNAKAKMKVWAFTPVGCIKRPSSRNLESTQRILRPDSRRWN